MPEINASKEEQKKILKEALQEWLDAKYAAFGRWAFRSLVAMGIATLGYFYFLTKLGK